MPSLSIVIPAYNEAHRLPESLGKVAACIPYCGYNPVEVIVVDDGSSDTTAESARALGGAISNAGGALRVLSNDGNQGKGYSVRRGIQAATYEWILFTDADLSAPIEELAALSEATKQDHEVAIGSRAIDRSLIGVHQPLYREAMGRVFNLMVRTVTGLRFSDTQCGFKLFRRDAAQSIASLQRLTGFGFDVEQLFLAHKLGLSVAEVPVRWNNAADSSVGALGGLGAFLDICRVRANALMGRYR